MDTLSSATLTMPAASPAMTMPGTVTLRHRPVNRPDRLAPQPTRFAPWRIFFTKRVLLELLQVVVDREVASVIETGDEADADLVVFHRVDERTAELPVLGGLRSGQPIVWMTRSSGSTSQIPDTELEALRIEAADVEVIERGIGEVVTTPSARRRTGDQVHARLEVAESLALGGRGPGHRNGFRATIWSLDQQLVGGGLGQDVAPISSAFRRGKRESRTEAAVVLEVRRHRRAEARASVRQTASCPPPPGKPATVPRQVGEEPSIAEGDVGAGYAVGATRPVFDDRDRNFPELPSARACPEQLEGLDGSSEAGPMPTIVTPTQCAHPRDRWAR